MAHFKTENGSTIEAENIELGKDFKMGHNVHIKVRGTFKIGDYGRFGDDVKINAEEVTIGHHFFHYEPGLDVGGGGAQFPDAIWKVGDRCVVHNNKINLARSVTFGDDVGLSPDVDIIGHGFWQSPLEGYPVKYGSVTLGNGVIVGQRSMILMDLSIADNVVIGAQSVVTKSLTMPGGIYGGNPAKLIRPVTLPSEIEKRKIFDDIIKQYEAIPGRVKLFSFSYPQVHINNAFIDVEKRGIVGTEDTQTDQFRDFLRRHGIRIYTTRPFVSL